MLGAVNLSKPGKKVAWVCIEAANHDDGLFFMAIIVGFVGPMMGK